MSQESDSGSEDESSQSSSSNSDEDDFENELNHYLGSCHIKDAQDPFEW